MSSPVPMPTARQGTEYIHLEREGHPIEALRAAVALVREEGLNPYHAAELHLKLAYIPEMGLDHASESVKIFTKLKETDGSRDIRWKLQEAENAMQEAQTIEKAWSKRLNTM
ncbi:uncharacterized protein FTJAE_3890 [Fusarium tjaetaba]|uniref:Uncharacterized protein n=1 Tax=Fusarium tjaetaba TaxID=1567544 RepID=A0A8H5W187_9HYPO|nr:uncharacterized protein FTJAE_3890 [Fusarium tjaetaba]KAF5641900.1 hypothetical protein FTJAE_3890 [Fusarium tjaetaba]